MPDTASSRTNHDPLFGRQLANFRLDRVIGRGGMAQVYLGWDIKLERPVAVKVIDARYRHKADYAERFVREARAVATWRHPNIIQIYYADNDDDGLYYYVMEYVDGLDLEELLDQYRRDGNLMPVEDVITIGRATAAALDYAHEQGIVHRDIKPSNVMIARDGRVLLTDFGLAMDVAQGSLGEVFGSPHYMAPEQARHSANAVPQSDLYALGVILYELLAGVPPFDDPAPAALALQHITTPAPSPRIHNPALNEATEAVLLRALSKLPDARYPTGAALLEALGAALGVSKTASGSTVPTPVVQPRQTATLTVAERIARYRAENPAPEVSAATRRGWTRVTGMKWPLVLVMLVVLLSLAGGTLLFSTAPESPPLTPAPSGTAAPVVALVTRTRPPPIVNLPEPSATPSPTPFSTAPPQPQPSLAATTLPTVAPRATVLYPDGNLVRLVYNNAGFYLINLGDRPVEAQRLTFEAIPPAGGPATYRFSGASWSQFYPLIVPERCNYIELFAPETSLARPVLCEEFNARQINIDPENSSVFWLNHAGETHFRVLWDEGEIGRCVMSDARCDVYLP